MKEKSTQTAHSQSRIRESTNYSINRIKAFASGDQESTGEILNSLIQSTAQNMTLFSQYLAAKDYKSITELAHKMLPMFRLLEAEAIVVQLAELEQNGMDENYETDIESIGQSVLLKIKKLAATIKSDHHIH